MVDVRIDYGNVSIGVYCFYSPFIHFHTNANIKPRTLYAEVKAHCTGKK